MDRTELPPSSLWGPGRQGDRKELPPSSLQGPEASGGQDGSCPAPCRDQRHQGDRMVLLPSSLPGPGHQGDRMVPLPSSLQGPEASGGQDDVPAQLPLGAMKTERWGAQSPVRAVGQEPGASVSLPRWRQGTWGARGSPAAGRPQGAPRSSSGCGPPTGGLLQVPQTPRGASPAEELCFQNTNETQSFGCFFFSF